MFTEILVTWSKWEHKISRNISQFLAEWSLRLTWDCQIYMTIFIPLRIYKNNYTVRTAEAWIFSKLQSEMVFHKRNILVFPTSYDNLFSENKLKERAREREEREWERSKKYGCWHKHYYNILHWCHQVEKAIRSMFRIRLQTPLWIFPNRFFFKIMNFSDCFRQCFHVTYISGNGNHKSYVFFVLYFPFEQGFF